MKYQTVLITPKKAAEWLKCGGKNRRVSHRHVKRLADEMVVGRWVLNGATIKFSSDGKLVDGQHRLHAAVLSDTSIYSSVAFGVDDERAFETIDTSQRLRGLDTIYGDIEGKENAALKIAVSRRLLSYEKTQNKNNFSMNSAIARDLTSHEVLEYARTYEAEINYIYSEVRSSLPYKRCGAPSALVASLILCNRADEVAAMMFIEGVKSGANLDGQSPIHLLRERLAFPPERRRGSHWDTELMALTIKVFNCYSQGKVLKTLRWRQDGDAPEKFPIPKGDS